MKHSMRFVQIVLLSLLIIAGGCQQTVQPIRQEQGISVKTAITADCIVSYFQQGKAPYITQQKHHFNPSAGYLGITAQEPTGYYKYTLLKDKFNSTKQNTGILSVQNASFVNQNLATCIFYSFLAGSNVLDVSSFISEANIKIEGQWYTPIQTIWPHGNLQITLLKNYDENIIDRVEIKDETSNIRWITKCYNFRYSKDLDVSAPRMVDVFDIHNGIASKELIMQFDYKSILKNKP